MRVSVEGPRGCGYRKAGGLYLVSGNLSEPCPRLPVETTTCPTCGEGIRPARGYTWVDGGKLIPPTVHGSDEHDVVCPLSPARNETGGYAERYPGDHAHYVSRLGDRCGLIWIGEQHYKTADEFMREAARMGVSRRIVAVPKDFEIGVTWVLLGHRKAIERACSDCGVDQSEAVTDADRHIEAKTFPYTRPDPDCPVCKGTGREHVSGIVTAFQPTAIEYVVKGDETDEELDALEKRGIEPVKVVRAGEQEALVSDG